MYHGKLTDMTLPPPDDVMRFLVGKHHEISDKCKKFQRWSTKRVRAFWQIANITLWVNTNTEQTLLDDYFPIAPEGFYYSWDRPLS